MPIGFPTMEFLVAVTASLLATSSKQRAIFLSLSLALLLVFGAYRPIFADQGWIFKPTVASERDQVIKILDDNPKVPYAAQYWSSIYDIVYLRKDEGEWRFGQDIQDLYGAKFFAVINNTFTDKKSDFFRSVNASCKSLTHSNNFSLFECNQSFQLNNNQ